MAINKNGLDLIKHFEGLRLEAYLDPVGILTIGWGHTGSDVFPGQKITLKQAEQLLEDDLSGHEAFVDRVVKVDLVENQRAALVSFAFNVGNGSLQSSTLLKRLNSGDYQGAAREFGRWVNGTHNGKKITLPGLVRRRRAEAQLFLDEVVDLAVPRPEIFAVESDTASLEHFSSAPIPLSQLGGNEDLVIAIQKRLAELGFLDPPADGKYGPVSHWALSEFCYVNGLSLGGGFTTEIARRLTDPTARLPDIVASGVPWLDEIVGNMMTKGHWICRHGECFNVVYVEGMDPDGKLNDDRPNVFNDLRIVFSIRADGVPEPHVWDATTEPGTFWTQKPMNPKGAARIAFGQYKSWVVGTHRSGTAAAHEALVQVEPVTVHRDLNKDYRRTNDELDTGLFGINQHWGYDAPKNDLGHTSAGCLVGRTKDGHREFMALMKSDPRYAANPAYRFMATVLPGNPANGG
jgi:GH24 family phage-related lysozyme (muramidase)